MKTTKLFTAVFAMTAMFTYAFASETIEKGNSLTAWGEYKIVKEESQQNFNSKSLETYSIHYSNVKSPVVVGVDRTKKCNTYVVRINGFEVQYVCTKRSFGVSHVSPLYSSGKKNSVTAMLDRSNFDRQKIITAGSKNNEEALKLIACYFPHLIKSELAFK